MNKRNCFFSLLIALILIFAGCSAEITSETHPYLAITEANIPDYVNGVKVTSLAVEAFVDCSSLESIYIDQEEGSLDLSNAGIPNDAKIYWKGEF